jgi:signal transduction histidine kinase
VPEELREQLFDRFTRADSGTGSGLGLAIARAYAQALGGELLYRGNEPGARFELLLPQD